MPAINRKTDPNFDQEKAKEQICAAIVRAIKSVGTQRDFTRKLNEGLAKVGRLGISEAAVHWWKTEGTFLDEIYWPIIEQMTDMATTRRHLRPDLYGMGQP